MSSSSPWAPDVWRWVSDLPPISKWSSTAMSISLCCRSSSSQPSLNISISKGTNSGVFLLSLVAQFHKLPISLWTSSSFRMGSGTTTTTDSQQTMFRLFHDVVDGVLHYGPAAGGSGSSKSGTCSSRNLSVSYDDGDDFGDVFNLAFLTLAFLVCVYEAPGDLLRTGCLETLRLRLMGPRARRTSKVLARWLGPNLEQKWMRSINLAVTNCIIGPKTSADSFMVPNSLFSCAFSTGSLWKVQLFCPVTAMRVENTNSSTQDERLLFSLRYQQLQGVFQLSYMVLLHESGIDLSVGVDNIRCDVSPLLSEALMAKRGLGSDEKHFPSRVSLHLTPVHQSDVAAVTVGKSSGNPARELALEKTMEGTLQPQNPYLGLTFAATETTKTIAKPWRFEQSAHGSTANLSWFLHDVGAGGREVHKTKPSKLPLLHHGVGFRDRYASANRPFTREGGVVFAGDQYRERVRWKMRRKAMGRKTLDWEMRGWVWLTYLPNKMWNHYTETRMVEFREVVQLPLPKL